MKLCIFVLLFVGSIYNSNASSIRTEEGPVSRASPTLFRQLLEDPSSVLNVSGKPMEDLQAQILSELDHMKTNTRSYLDQIRALLMNFACRIGLTRFCVTNDLPVVEDLPEVPPFPDDWRSTEPPTVKGSSTSKVETPVAPAPAKTRTEGEPAEPKVLTQLASTIMLEPTPSGTAAQDQPPKPTDVVVVDALPPLQEIPTPTADPEQPDQIKQNLTEPDTSIPKLHV